MKICASCGRVDDGRLGKADREGGDAVGIGFGQVLDRRALVAGGLVVGHAKLISGITRTSRRGSDQHIAFKLQAGRRRAIEKMAVDFKFYWSFSIDLLRFAG